MLLSGSVTLTGLDLDAVRGGMLLPRLAQQRVHQAGLAHFAFADQDEFGFVEGDLRGGFGAQVGFDRLEALFVGCGEFRVEGVEVEVELFQMLKLGERLW